MLPLPSLTPPELKRVDGPSDDYPLLLGSLALYEDMAQMPSRFP